MMGGSSGERSYETAFNTDQSTNTGRVSKVSLKTKHSGSEVSKVSLKTKHSGSEVTQSRDDHVTSKASEINRIRIVLCVSLIVLAAVLGASVYAFFQAPELKLATEQFESIANRATQYAQLTTKTKRSGVITMATMIGVAHPNKEDWPFVLVDGYDAISSGLVETISGDGMGFAPIVAPEDLDDFEAFAYDSYYNTLGYPNGTAISSFGMGVWAKDSKGIFEETGEDQKYHEGTVHPNGETTYGSSYQIYAPILQHSDGANAKPLMLNLHNEQHRGETIDSILCCAEGKNNTSTECGQLTDLLLLTQRKNPATLIMQPIHPVNDPQEVTGIVSSPFVWQDSLDNAFGMEVSGIHCVLASSTGITYTYMVKKGLVELV